MTVHEPTGQLPSPLFPAIPICWPFLSEIAAEDTMDQVEDWVTMIVDRYALDHRVVPPCWDQHGALVEELSALYTAWLAAFSIIGRPEAPLEWHQHFAGARQRLSDWASRTGCRPGEHRPSPPASHSGRGCP